jgi:CubicO group peptidase (beta-lactamase class C family)
VTAIVSRFPVLCVAVLLFCSPNCHAQSDSNTQTEKIEQLVQAYHDYGQFNGSVLVAKNGKPIVRKGFGFANMEWEVPNGPNTKFRIGSVTKQFTAALILQLVEKGQVELDQPITSYLPDYRKDTGDKVTVHHLLNHTSGVPSYTTNEFFANHSRDSYELDEFVERFCSGDLEFEPGAEYTYSNSGYHLLGVIIEKVTGQPYAEVLQENILQPLNMNNSGFDVSRTVMKNRAQGYSKTSDGYVNANYLDMGIPYSAGSMYSTVDDLLLWDQALYENKILSAESKALMFKPGKGSYGYGIATSEHKFRESGETLKFLQHGGGINGFNCQFSRVVQQNLVVVVLDNVEMGRYHMPMTHAIIDILNDQPFDKPKRSLVEALRDTAIGKGGAAAVAEYRELKSNSPDEYDFGEMELNVLGYELLEREMLKDAIDIFRLNVEMFPEAFNPHDSLGEALLADGQKELALKSYRTSVELNPNNEGGKLAIQKIEGAVTDVDVEVLKTYEGSYELRPGMVVTMRVDEDGSLKAKPGDQPEVTLECVSKTTFFEPSIKANIEFQTGDDGKVSGMIFRQGGREMEATKIK